MNTSLSMPSWRRRLQATALFAVGGIILFGPELLDSAGARSEERRSDSEKTITVRVAKVRANQGSIGGGLRAVGTLEPLREVQLAFAVEGVVQRWSADDGDDVAEGALLAALDPTPFEAEVSRAQARVDYLEKSLARSRRLREQDALTSEEFEAQQAELSGAQAALRLARWRLGRSSLRAPFGARVVRRMAEVGQVVAPGAAAFDLMEVERLQMDAALAAIDLPRVDLQAPVEVHVRGREDLRARGHIVHAPVRSDARSGSVPLRVRIDNPGGLFLAGMVAEARFGETGPRAGRTELRVHLSAIRVDDDGPSVWRVEDRSVVRVPVEVGAVRGDEVVVGGGLRDGDRVVLQPPDRLREGSAVRIVEGDLR